MQTWWQRSQLWVVPELANKPTGAADTVDGRASRSDRTPGDLGADNWRGGMESMPGLLHLHAARPLLLQQTYFGPYFKTVDTVQHKKWEKKKAREHKMRSSKAHKSKGGAIMTKVCLA